jgi:hypothetical protein
MVQNSKEVAYMSMCTLGTSFANALLILNVVGNTNRHSFLSKCCAILGLYKFW